MHGQLVQSRRFIFGRGYEVEIRLLLFVASLGRGGAHLAHSRLSKLPQSDLHEEFGAAGGRDLSDATG